MVMAKFLTKIFNYLLEENSFKRKDNILDGKNINKQRFIAVIMINVSNKHNLTVIIAFYIKKCTQISLFKFFQKFITN
jgi:hypothetical protein